MKPKTRFGGRNIAGSELLSFSIIYLRKETRLTRNHEGLEKPVKLDWFLALAVDGVVNGRKQRLWAAVEAEVAVECGLLWSAGLRCCGVAGCGVAVLRGCGVAGGRSCEGAGLRGWGCGRGLLVAGRRGWRVAQLGR